MTKNGMRPVPPGEILEEEFMKPAGIKPYTLAQAIGVPANRITGILKGQRGITGDTALRLSAFFGTTADVWLNLQMNYELRLAEKALGQKELKSIQKRRADLAALATN